MSDYLEVHALADGELTGAEAAAVQSGIDADPNLKAEYETVRMVKKAVSSNCKSFMDEEVWKSCRSRLDEIDSTRKAERFVTKNAWALCTAVFIVIVGAAFFNRNLAKNQLDTGQMARIVSGMSPVTMPQTNEPEKMRNFINSVAGDAPMQIQNDSLRVMQVSRGVDEEGRKVMQFCMLAGSDPVTLTVVGNTDQMHIGDRVIENGQVCFCRVNDANCLAWIDRGFALLLAGDRSHEDLQRIAEQIRINR